NNMSFGLSLFSENNIGLVSNTGYATAAYKVNFNHNHFIKFGLSAGIIQNTLDPQSLVNYPELMEDPAIINAIDNTFYLSSQFGIKYQLNKLSVGIAFPKFFENQAYSESVINRPSFDQLKQFIANISYDFAINESINFKPYALLRYADKNYFQAELTGVFNYKEAFWVGAGYRYESGPIGHIGFNLKESISLSYAFENNFISSKTIDGGIHEIQLKFILKRKTKEEFINEKIVSEHKVIKEIPSKAITKDAVSDSLQNEVLEKTTSSNDTSKYVPVLKETTKKLADSINVKPIENQTPLIENEVSKSNRMDKGFYVIVGVFSNLENADRHAKNVTEKGFTSIVYFNKSKGYYYVSIIKSENEKSAIERRNYIRQINLFNFSEAWILKVE
ncbi:MAG: type IX secretion system PorP/SprF family membrane protein, partial [Marivirga sp.]